MYSPKCVPLGTEKFEIVQQKSPKFIIPENSRDI